jgi:hypothetical protein
MAHEALGYVHEPSATKATTVAIEALADLAPAARRFADIPCSDDEQSGDWIPDGLVGHEGNTYLVVKNLPRHIQVNGKDLPAVRALRLEGMWCPG